MNDLKEGILYIATGRKYIKEALYSAKSCKKTNKYPIALITDKNHEIIEKDVFDIIIIKEAVYNYRDKLLLKYTPFEKTIFIDTDTLVIDKLNDLFRLLDFREFAIHQADEGYEFEMSDVCNAMPEFNTGVIAYKNTPAVQQLFKDWCNSFDLIPEIKTDQYHLRKTLYESNIRFAIFSSAYNFIVYYPNYVIQHVKILHGRPFSLLEEVATKINDVKHQNGWRRLYYPANNKSYILYAHLTKKDSFNILLHSFRIYIANVVRPLKKIFK